MNDWLIGSYSDIEHIWQLMHRFGFYRGGAVMMSALSGIDIALWDLKGVCDLPVSWKARMLRGEIGS
jgi:L-alanine-DL-glutamate epimerase-like enolase superfamily enzyme